MSLKITQESGSYMDAVKVKIAEEYKPPPKINILMTHTQRLTFNKQIQENLPNYDPSMEHNVLQKVREWKNSRIINENQRKTRLQSLKEKEEAEETETEEAASPESVDVPSTSYENEVVISTVGPSYTANGMLLPTKVTNYYSSILQPIPLKSNSQNFSNNSEIKSPFNISEFEADTSSPFDNVALKSINDVEELAKVLKLEDVVPKHSTAVSYSDFHVNSQAYSNYTGISTFVPTSSYSNHNSNTGVNGYYSCDTESVKSYPSNFQCSSPLKNYLSSYSNHIAHQEIISADNEKCSKIINFSSVPSKNINESHHRNLVDSKTKPVPIRKISQTIVDLPDPFDELPKHLQDMSRSISSMGFPLSRVARTCKAIGNDNKKVVDHLLAMSELLDLGFAEDKVSEALLLYDNDRDKALDKLIS